jgi:hypothetical protein
VTRFAASQQAQRTAIQKTPDGGPRGTIANADTTSEPSHGKAKAQLAFETAVTQEMRVDGVVNWVESEVRNEEVFELFPHPYGIEFLGFHDG